MPKHMQIPKSGTSSKARSCKVVQKVPGTVVPVGCLQDVSPRMCRNRQVEKSGKAWVLLLEQSVEHVGAKVGLNRMNQSNH